MNNCNPQSMSVLQVSEAFCSILFGQGEWACLRILASCVHLWFCCTLSVMLMLLHQCPRQGQQLTYTILLFDVDYKKHLLISAEDFVALQSN